MKKMLMIFFLLLEHFFCFSQTFLLQSIKAPGETSHSVIERTVIGENIIGPRRVLFLKEQMTLQKEEVSKNITNSNLKVDKLSTLYSGKIFSDGTIEPFIFENKTPEELVLLEILVFPTILEQPYTLYIDLIIVVSSKPITNKDSDDAGEYKANISITLNEI